MTMAENEETTMDHDGNVYMELAADEEDKGGIEKSTHTSFESEHIDHDETMNNSELDTKAKDPKVSANERKEENRRSVTVTQDPTAKDPVYIVARSNPFKFKGSPHLDEYTALNPQTTEPAGKVESDKARDPPISIGGGGDFNLESGLIRESTKPGSRCCHPNVIRSVIVIGSFLIAAALAFVAYRLINKTSFSGEEALASHCVYSENFGGGLDGLWKPLDLDNATRESYVLYNKVDADNYHLYLAPAIFGGLDAWCIGSTTDSTDIAFFCLRYDLKDCANGTWWRRDDDKWATDSQLGVYMLEEGQCITENPTSEPTVEPTAPSLAPSLAPSPAPSAAPSSSPTPMPTRPPTASPTWAPSLAPTDASIIPECTYIPIWSMLLVLFLC